jgi:hypothetical protein
LSEIWRPVPGYEGDYEASSHGRIRSWVWRGNPKHGAKLLPEPRIIEGWVNSHGRRYVTLRARSQPVGRVICSAFHGPASLKYDAAHYDGDKLNNRPDNLRWATRAENEADKNRHGTRHRGSQLWFSKLTEDGVRAIRSFRESGRSYSWLAAEFQVSMSSIVAVLKGRTWKHVK